MAAPSSASSRGGAIMSSVALTFFAYLGFAVISYVDSLETADVAGA